MGEVRKSDRSADASRVRPRTFFSLPKEAQRHNTRAHAEIHAATCVTRQAQWSGGICLFYVMEGLPADMLSYQRHARACFFV